LICGAAKISFSPVKRAAGAMERQFSVAGAASESPLVPVSPSDMACKRLGANPFLADLSDVQHSVFFADVLKKISEANALNPRLGFVYAARHAAAPAAAAPAAEPSVQSDGSEKKKKPKVSREKGPFSTLANAGITV
jgi:hypothetical protein